MGQYTSEYNLSNDFEFIYTPRRLVLKHAAMPVSQEDTTVEFFGPPMVAAVKDGEPTKAAEGFARKCGVALMHLDVVRKMVRKYFTLKKKKKAVTLLHSSRDVREMVSFYGIWKNDALGKQNR